MNEDDSIDVIPFQIKIAEEHELEYKKIYMHMLNRSGKRAGVFDDNMFQKLEIMIEKLKA